MRKKNHKCLLIQTKDNRKFFTHEKNFNQLIEFANTFGAQISIVHLEHGDILDLSPLAVAMSDERYNKPSKFTVLEKKAAGQIVATLPIASISEKVPQRQDAVSLRAYMKGRLESGEVVDIKMVATHFPNFTTKSISAYLTKIKRDLAQRGNVVTKLSTGRYRLQRRTLTMPPRSISPLHLEYDRDSRKLRRSDLYADFSTLQQSDNDE